MSLPLTPLSGISVALMVICRFWAGILRYRNSRVVHPDIPGIGDDDDDDKVCCGAATADLLAPMFTSWIGAIIHVLFVFAAGAGAVFALLPTRVIALCVCQKFPLRCVCFLVVPQLFHC